MGMNDAKRSWVLKAIALTLMLTLVGTFYIDFWSFLDTFRASQTEQRATCIQQTALETSQSSSKESVRPKLADGCRHVYLDVGGNIGVQVRKLFESEKYPRAPMIQVFERLFGDQKERRKNVCAFTFEMNPDHESRLRFLEDCYNKLGWFTKAFVPKAVSNVDGQRLKVFRENSSNKSENLATTLFRNKEWVYKNNRVVYVESLDLGKFIMDHIAGRKIPDEPGPEPRVFAKVDIEGAEYMVIPGLLVKGALCHIDEAVVEYHRNFMTKPADAKAADLVRTIVNSFNALDAKYTGCNMTKFQVLDDEMYYTDPKPFPEECGDFDKP